MFAGGCEGTHKTVNPVLFAITLPETWICCAVVVIAGVTSTSTVAETQGRVEHTDSVGIKQEIVPDDCWNALQFPVPLVTIAVGVFDSPVLGRPPAVKNTCDALSGPLFVMLNVNATWVPAATGLGVGLDAAGANKSVLAAPILLTKAFCVPFNCP